MTAEFYVVRDAVTLHVVSVADAFPPAVATARAYGCHCFVDLVPAGAVRAGEGVDNVFEVGPDGAECLHDRRLPLPAAAGEPPSAAAAGEPLSAAAAGEPLSAAAAARRALVQRTRAALATGAPYQLVAHEIGAPPAESPAATLSRLAEEAGALAAAAGELGYRTKIGGTLTVTHWRA